VLFDLQSPGRRRVVRITFGALAAIFAISFVFLGVGTGGGGFSFSDLFGSGGGSDTSSAFDDDIKAQEERLAVNPNDTAALAQLVSLHYQAGSQQVDVDEDTGSQTLTEEGTQDLQQSVDAWAKYMKAAGPNVSAGTATFAVQANALLADDTLAKAVQSTNGQTALDDANIAIANYKGAAEAQQILFEKRPNSATADGYLNLAYFYYRAGEIEQGDAAGEQAKSAATGSDRQQVEQSLKQLQQQGTQLSQAIAELEKTLKQQQGATGGGGGNPLGGVGGGGALGGGGLGGTGGLGGQ
jgi:hypothetical protein